MNFAIIIIICCGIGLIIWAYLASRKDDSEIVMPAKDCSSCGIIDEKCEQECLMEAATKEIEYYDDEELDRYKGRAAHEYSDNEADEFREVMMTMKKEEVKGWNRSLILRGIEMPDQIKDEALILMDE
jgi:hypothetical protein